MTRATAAYCLLLAALLGGCGQMGPLYMPPEEAPAVTAPGATEAPPSTKEDG